MLFSISGILARIAECFLTWWAETNLYLLKCHPYKKCLKDSCSCTRESSTASLGSELKDGFVERYLCTSSYNLF